MDAISDICDVDEDPLFVVSVGHFVVVFYILGGSLSLSRNVDLALCLKCYDTGRNNLCCAF